MTKDAGGRHPPVAVENRRHLFRSFGKHFLGKDGGRDRD